MNKYEVRLKVVFFYLASIVKKLTLIDCIEAEDIIQAIKKSNTLVANLRCEIQASVDDRGQMYDELVNFEDIDDYDIEVSAICAVKE